LNTQFGQEIAKESRGIQLSPTAVLLSRATGYRMTCPGHAALILTNKFGSHEVATFPQTWIGEEVHHRLDRFFSMPFSAERVAKKHQFHPSLIHCSWHLTM